jgi:hypothetical protein
MTVLRGRRRFPAPKRKWPHLASGIYAANSRRRVVTHAAGADGLEGAGDVLADVLSERVVVLDQRGEIDTAIGRAAGPSVGCYSMTSSALTSKVWDRETKRGGGLAGEGGLASSGKETETDRRPRVEPVRAAWEARPEKS